MITPPVVDPRNSTRERFQEHTADAFCASCHQLMDPIGFAFEHYDATGRWRDIDADMPVDATGSADRDRRRWPIDGVHQLTSKLPKSAQVESCVATQWFRWAFGRTEQTPDDVCTIGQLAHALDAAAATCAACARDGEVADVPARGLSRAAALSAPWSASRGARSCAAPSARRSRCPGSSRWCRAAPGRPASPTRFVVMFSPNGTIPAQWTPTGTETNFTLSPILSPLAPHQDKLVVIQGVDQRGGGGDGHQNGIGGMLTGQPLNSGPFAGMGSAPAGWPNGPSVDQRIAEVIAAPTPLRSLELGVQVGAADNWGRMIYRAANQPLPPEDDPGAGLRQRLRRPARRSSGAGGAARAAKVDPRHRGRAVHAHRGAARHRGRSASTST